MLVELGRALAQIRPTWARVGRKIRSNSCNFGRVWTKRVPNLKDSGPHLVDIAQIALKSKKVWTGWGVLGRIELLKEDVPSKGGLSKLSLSCDPRENRQTC